MKKYDLTVAIPSIRVQNLEKIYFFLERAVEPFSFEMVVIGPYEIPNVLKEKHNVKYFKDMGSPSRCVQIGSTLAEGKYFCWMSDDCVHITPHSISQCITLLDNTDGKDAITLRYFEGEGSNSNEFPMDYWRAHHHDDQKLLGIKNTFMCAPLGMYNTDYFRELGGLDCRWQHINFCTHDLAFRLQQNGGKVHLSPQSVAKFYWSWITADAEPVRIVHVQNDAPLFKEVWNQDQSQRIKIDYYNWVNTPSKWELRFGK